MACVVLKYSFNLYLCTLYIPMACVVLKYSFNLYLCTLNIPMACVVLKYSFNVRVSSVTTPWRRRSGWRVPTSTSTEARIRARPKRIGLINSPAGGTCCSFLRGHRGRKARGLQGTNALLQPKTTTLSHSTTPVFLNSFIYAGFRLRSSPHSL